ncbi:hypothetical protein HK098_003224 [Nowakowskiella sp. JEL0407]|nr:hypothetical protein HK098_003224 [Nowakowskiella sp. JEL0407]
MEGRRPLVLETEYAPGKVFRHADTKLFPPEVAQGIFLNSLKYKPTPDDIILATYPKCGTTWTQYIILLLLRNGEPLAENENLHLLFAFPEMFGTDSLETLPHRLIKTHLPYNICPKSTEAKYIHVVRNPKDCVVSYYHHTVGFPAYEFKGASFDDFFETFMEAKCDAEDFFDYMLSWYPQINDSNVLFLVYEDMKVDPRGSIVKIAKFLGIEVSDEVIDKVLDLSSISSMKKETKIVPMGRDADAANWVRKGVSGDWRNYLSAEQSKRMDDKFREKFEGTGIDKIWSEELLRFSEE